MNLVFDHQFNNQALVLDQKYAYGASNDSIQIERFKYYISAIELYNENERIYVEQNSFHLVDLEDSSTWNMVLEMEGKIDFSHIQFHLGLDSLTNVSGAMGGDLDPTKGMYWTWQSGYINFKLEGKSNLCPTRNNVFQFHLGGYVYPNATLQTVRLAVEKAKENTSILIQTDIGVFLNLINLAEQNEVMSLGQESKELSNQTSQIFRISNE